MAIVPLIVSSQHVIVARMTSSTYCRFARTNGSLKLIIALFFKENDIDVDAALEQAHEPSRHCVCSIEGTMKETSPNVGNRLCEYADVISLSTRLHCHG